MKTSLLTALAALGLMGTASADVVCQKCEYLNHGATYVYYPGTYLGSYWPGDRGTFVDTNIKADLDGRLGLFNDSWIVDLNQNGIVEITVTTKNATAFDESVRPEFGGPFAVEMSWDHGSVCEATPGGFCDRVPTIHAEDVVLSEWSQRASRWTFRTGALVPGRYLLRVVAATRIDGESAYQAKIVVKAAP